VTGFLARHKQLTVRTCNMIIRSRTVITQKDVLDFFKRFMKSAEGLPPENKYYSDQTNLSNDPRTANTIFRRGVKYAEHQDLYLHYVLWHCCWGDASFLHCLQDREKYYGINRY
jgi:hypothetical protein